MWLLSEKFRIASKTDEFDDLFTFINPYQQEVILNMTFKRTSIIAGQRMWPVFFRDHTCFRQMRKTGQPTTWRPGWRCDIRRGSGRSYGGRRWRNSHDCCSQHCRPPPWCSSSCWSAAPWPCSSAPRWWTSPARTRYIPWKSYGKRNRVLIFRALFLVITI